MRPPHVRMSAVGLLLALVAAGCASTTPAPSPADTPSPAPDAVASPLPSPSSVVSPSPTSSPTATPLAGEPHDGPPLGGQPASLAVSGVAADDVLNVRAGPGTDQDVIATLDPLATDVAASGAARSLPGSIWLEVDVDGTTGWANSTFLASLGGTDDVTARIVDDAGGRPTAPTLQELATDVGALVAAEDPPSRIVISDGPSVGDLGEVTVDVVGLGGDAVRGLRLVVFATVQDGGFTLRTVEATQLCGRGVDDGQCV